MVGLGHNTTLNNMRQQPFSYSHVCVAHNGATIHIAPLSKKKPHPYNNNSLDYIEEWKKKLMN
jgi:predicted glutamine amidotransferase